MRLVSCYVENFGKLKAYSCEFSSGLNCIVHENGWGKSTLMAFIKCMFYGLANDRPNNQKSERRKYEPWQGGVFGGSLRFEMDGCEYEIKRTFGTKASEARISVIDCGTNLLCEKFGVNPGREIFGIDEDSFERSCFIAQGSVPGDGAVPGDINAKIGNLADNTDDLGNFEIAIKNIHDKLNKLAENKATGEINKLKAEAVALKGEIALEESLEKSMEILRDNVAGSQAGISELENENARLTKEIGELTRWQDEQILREQYRLLDERYCDAKAAADDAQAQVRKIKRAGGVSATGEAGDGDASGGREGASANAFRRSGLGIVGAVLLGIGIVDIVIALIQNNSYDTILAIIGGILLAVGIVLLIIGSVQNSKARREEEAWRMDLAAAQGKLDSALNVLTAADVALNDFKAKHGTEFLNANDHLGFGEGSGREFKTGVEINEKIKANSNEIERLRGFIKSYNNQLEDKQSKLDEIAEMKTRLGEITTAIEAGKVLVRRLEIAGDLLTVAKNNMTSKYIDPISARFLYYYKMVTGAEGSEYVVDATSNVSVDQAGALRGTGTLSTGLQDAVGFCLRMSLIDAMYPGERPPVILDDAFANMDDANYAGAMRVLDEVAREYQVIYFTCHGK